MVVVNTLDTNVTTRVTQTTIGDIAGILLTYGNRFLFGQFKRIPLIALGTLIGKAHLTCLAIVDSANLITLFPAIRFLVAFLADRTILSQISLITIWNISGDTFMTVEI